VAEPDRSTEFSGRVAIVCGASRGMGLAIAERLVDRGACVVLSSRKQDGLDAAVDSINTRHPDRAFAVVANASRREDMTELVARTMEKYGRADLVVYNAGASPYYGPLVESPPEAWDKAFQVNVMGALALVQAAVHAWMQEHGGAIVTVASLGGLTPRLNTGVYNITKAALIMLTRQLAKELGPSNIRVNAVAPGLVKTDFSAALWQDEERLQMVLKENPLGRIGTTTEVAESVVFLLSGAAGFITGHTLVIDGGSGGAR
jgi:NAD(P)-dependent dehydrogenase (short-subunit alcohol dehydrogenase family)